MRQIGSLDNELDANLFRDFLYNRNIECDIEPHAQGGWTVWVHDEDRLSEVVRLFEEFKADPQSQTFVNGAEGADRTRAAREKEEREQARKEQRRASVHQVLGYAGTGHATLALMVVSVVVTLLIQFGRNQAVFRFLLISEQPFLPSLNLILPEVLSGQFWRLITPVFMHLGVIHLLFNMMWLKDLGSMIEQVRGRTFMLVFVLVAGVLSNFGQYVVSGPAFGGMSGVIYGMLGYVWVQSRLNPWSGFVMHSFTFNMMMVWFALCLSGFMGPVANTTHGVGLVVGLAWGYLNARSR